MAILLTWAQQQATKPWSANSASKYDLIAAEVESLEIDKLLGPAFYQAISSKPDDYKDLLNATEYTRQDGKTKITHRGLRYVIAYLNYAKYIGESYIQDTFSGLKQKVTPDSEAISTGDIKRLQHENREIAFNAFALIREYLDLNRDKYPLWDRTKERRTNKPNFYGIKNTAL